jgi:hypothetical protein
MRDYEDEFGHSSPLLESAVSMHELYCTLKQAGFSRRDALELVSRVIVYAINNMSEYENDEEGDDD